MPILDPLDQLRKIAALKDEGILAPDEFERIKAELLNKAVHCEAAPASASERVTQNDLINSRNQLKSRESSFNSLRKVRHTRARQLKGQRLKLRYCKLLQKARVSLGDIVLGRVGPIAIIAGLGVLLGVVAFDVLSLGPILIGGVIGFLIMLLVAVHTFVFPTDGSIRANIQSSETTIRDLQTALAHDEAAFQLAKTNLQNARADLKNLLAKFQSRRNVLLSMDWRTLRGIPFEFFLRDIFEDLGFKVTGTKTSGDQGIDLIAERDGLKLAIQAKGYAESVGNKAVQEAHTGMCFYGCNRCAVITNSVFTSAAVELAQRVKCLLIDGSQIQSLILGKVQL